MRRRRFAVGEAEVAAAAAATGADKMERERAKEALKSAGILSDVGARSFKETNERRGSLGGRKAAEAMAQGEATANGIVLRVGLTHTPDCECNQCARRKQLLQWRDSMLLAQRHVDSERARFMAAKGSGRKLLSDSPPSVASTVGRGKFDME